jgi:hypothetical protein
MLWYFDLSRLPQAPTTIKAIIAPLKGVDLQLDEEELKFCNEIWYQLPREQDPTIARR